jgi:hypothetical protein
MKKLVGLVVVVGVLVAGDAWLRATAETRVAAELQSSFDDTGEAEIDFGGFPFAARVLSGTIPVARLTSTSLVRAGVRLSDVRMTMQDVEFSWSKVLVGEVGSVTVRAGKGSAALGARALNRALAAVDPRVEVTLTGNKIRATLGPVSGSGDLAIEGTELILTIAGTERTVIVPLPRFVAGLRYEAVRIEEGRATIEFALDGATFDDL